MKFNLRAKFLIPTTALVIVSVLILTAVSYTKAKKVLLDGINMQITQAADSTEKLINSWIERTQLDLSGLANQQIFRTAIGDSFMNDVARKAAVDQLVQLTKEYKHFLNIFLVDKNGAVVSSAFSKLVVENNLSHHPFFKAVLAGNFSLTEVTRRGTTGKSSFMIAAPIKQKEQVAGALVGVVDMVHFSRILIDPVKIGIDGHAYLCDRQGLVIAHPDRSQIMRTDVKTYVSDKGILSRDKSIDSHRVKGVARMSAFHKCSFKDWFLVVTANTDEITTPVKAIGYTNLTIGLIITLSLMLAVWVLASKLIIDPISEIAARLKDMAQGEGDLSNRLEITTHDEIGELAKWFNQFIEKLRSIIENISGNTKIVKESASDLSNLSNNMTASSEKMAEQSGYIAGSLEETSANVNTMASATEQMSVNAGGVSSTTELMVQNINSVSDAVKQISVSMNDIGKSSQSSSMIATEAMQMAETATSTMNTLSQAANEIGKVTDVIKRIAGQTNLLALNATIEAASAGEAGKGFAVVANEIKELANQSAQAAADIQKRIDGVQTNAGKALDVLKQITGIINQINSAVSISTSEVNDQLHVTGETAGNMVQLNDAVGKIAAAIREVAEGINDVSKNTSESAKGINDVTRNLHRLNMVAKVAKSGAMQVDSAAKELTQVAAVLQDSVDTFKL